MGTNYLRTFAKIPMNAQRVLSSPDGACIFALFAKTNERVDHFSDTSVDSHISGTTEQLNDERVLSPRSNGGQDADHVYLENPLSMDMDTVENLVHAHVFYLDKNEQSNSLIKTITFPRPMLPYCQFTSIENIQHHLVSLDLENSRLMSRKVCITGEKNKFQIRRNINDIIDGKVKIDNSTTVLGKCTKFTKQVQVGQYIVIKSEKKPVLNILSDTVLEVGDGGFQSLIGIKTWNSYTVEEKPTTNGYLDVYSQLFTKYPILPCINNGFVPMELTIVIDTLETAETNLETLRNRFNDYMKSQFQRLFEVTKKDTGPLENFSVHVARYDDGFFTNILERGASRYRADE